MNLRVGTDDVRSQLRNPMKLARGLGSAKSGVEHWWVQRLTRPRWWCWASGS